MLDVDTAAEYCLAKGLIGRDAVIDGELTVSSVLRRNRNVQVTARPGVGCFLKQADEPAPDGSLPLRREAAFYAACQQGSAVAMARFLPRLVHYDDSRPLLALALVGNSTSLWQQFQLREAQDFPVGLARELGVVLATLHTTFNPIGSSRSPDLSWLPRQVPWALRIHQPTPEALAALSPANHEALRILQTKDRLGERLGPLREQWQPDTVIHNDIKSDNVLVVLPTPGKGDGSGQVLLIDWECAQIGDPAWDVAAAFQELVFYWVASLPLQASLDLGTIVAATRYPWSTVRGAVQAFWQGYRDAAGLRPAEADRLSIRAVGFSAARLIQTVFELDQAKQKISMESILLLQISANLLADVQSASVQFYGIA